MLNTTQVVNKVFKDGNDKNHYPLVEILFEDDKGHIAYGTYNVEIKNYVVIKGSSAIFAIIDRYNETIKSSKIKKFIKVKKIVN